MKQGAKRKPVDGDQQVARVRRICLALPEAWEKLSHGEPTFFVKKKVFAMCSINHHSDGHIAIVCPAPIGVQQALIEAAPKKYYRPPYVGRLGRRRAAARQRQRVRNAFVRGVAIDRAAKTAGQMSQNRLR